VAVACFAVLYFVVGTTVLVGSVQDKNWLVAGGAALFLTIGSLLVLAHLVVRALSAVTSWNRTRGE